MVFTSPHIAIVDDDPGVRRALRRLALSLGYEPVTFASGEEFLASLGGGLPDCLILDLHLPGMSGVDVLAELGAGGFAFPVIVITGLDQPGVRDKCFRAGAADYLTKPIEMSIFSSAVDLATGGRRSAVPR